MKNILDNIRANKKFYIIFLVILAAGIYFRNYHFHDWLRFSEDEARDAAIIDGAITGRQPLPLLGPLAGTSVFRLGPAYYYMQYLSARIFGNQPVKLAYPDLFFSVLAIPFLYLLLKKYFSRNISLATAAVFSFSFFIIKYSRFAWNPNSTPFFSILFLYSFLQIADPKTKKKYLWSILAGLALGIGIQLHTVFFLVFPFLFFIASAYGLKKRLFVWRAIAIVILAAFLCNIPQAIFEIQSHGENTKAFLGEALKRDEKGESIPKKIVSVFFCQLQANAMITTYLASDNRCNYFLKRGGDIRNNFSAAPVSERNYFFLELIFGLIFSLGGYFLLVLFLRRETDAPKKNFLKLMLLFIVVSIVVLTPMIEGVYTRFLLPLIFVSFFIFALWAKYLSEKFRKFSSTIIFLLVIFFLGFNIFQIRKSFIAYTTAGTTGQNILESITLGEEEFLSEFILRNSKNFRTAYIQGGYEDIFKFIEPARYFFSVRPDLAVKIASDKTATEPDTSYFLVRMIGWNERRVQMSQQTIQNRDVLDRATFARYVIFRLSGPLVSKNNSLLQKQVGN